MRRPFPADGEGSGVGWLWIETGAADHGQDHPGAGLAR